MRYLLLSLLLLCASTAIADHRSPVYLLTTTDMNSLSSGFQYALNKSPNHQAVDWANPASGLRGSTVPLRSYQTTYGQYCREYLSTVQLGGAVQQAFGTACLKSDGRWKIAGETPVKRSGPQMKFAYLQQSSSGGCSSANHPGGQQVQRNKQFHSDEFLRRARQLNQPGHPEKKMQRDPTRQPSKLLKLVAY